MRLDTDVVFVKKGEGSHYDTDIGEVVETPPDEKIVSANVTDLGIERSMKLFGDVKEQRLVIRLLKPYTGLFDYIRINSKTYKPTTMREPLSRYSIFVDEVTL